MLSYESTLFLAVVGSLIFAGCAWLFSFGNSVDMFDEIRRMDKRQLIYQFLNFAMIVSSALMLWKGLFVLTHCESPIVVVLSGSMQPAYYRGDLLFLTNHPEPVRVGDVAVFRIKGRNIPIVHRVIKVHEKEDGYVKFLTKGDNNNIDDRGLYNEGQLWLEKGDLIGKAKGYFPYVGMMTILMNDKPNLKFALLGLLALFVLIKREQ